MREICTKVRSGLRNFKVFVVVVVVVFVRRPTVDRAYKEEGELSILLLFVVVSVGNNNIGLVSLLRNLMCEEKEFKPFGVEEGWEASFGLLHRDF